MRGASVVKPDRNGLLLLFKILFESEEERQLLHTMNLQL